MDKGHGRVERRPLRTTPIRTLGSAWAGVRQGFEITRERTTHGTRTVEVGYGITSLPEDRADAVALRADLRAHWRIEAQVHYVRDVTLGEDTCRVRSGNAPQVLAGIRNAVIHLLADVDAESGPEAIEILQVHPHKARELIGIPQDE